MGETTMDPALNGTGSLLDQLGALRAEREAETTTDLALPGFVGRLWATVRLPRTEKATQVQAFMATAQPGMLEACTELVAYSTAGLYLADAGMEGPIHDPQTGDLNAGFHHLPGGSDLMPVTFDHRLEAVPQLCPPRPGSQHTPESRVRTLFGRDSMAAMFAFLIAGWANGGGESQGALDALSEKFVGESKGDLT